MIDLNSWFMNSGAILKSKKFYSHFDVRTDITKCKDYISIPENIISHGFYPFIHYEKKFIKYSKDKGKKVKTRDICYAAHIDRCIYQFYSYILNEYYNKKVDDIGISSAVIAYRTNLNKKSNIEFSKSAFDFIRSNSPCHIMIGDFTGFFDNIDHNYLKKQWCQLLNTEKLPEDHYVIFKNITKYSKWELFDILKINKLDYNKKSIHKLNSKEKILSREQFHKNRSHIIKNKNSYGIPQGSPISATLANIYMLEADKSINEIISKIGGLYMRYSDDFIIICPSDSLKSPPKEFKNVIEIIKNIPRLTLEPDKTKCYYFEESKIVKLNDLNTCGIINDKNAQMINFLGFSFDGCKVYLRAKTISKYYYRMYKKAKTITKSHGYTYRGNHISNRNLYERYSQRGAHRPDKKGNFLTYIDRSINVYGKNEEINKSTKNHMQKIRKALKKKS